MREKYTAVVEKDGEWYTGHCPEVPGTNGQGRTQQECVQNLRDAIALILDDNAGDGFPRSGLSKD